MRQAVLRAPRELELVEVPVPEPGEGELVVRVQVALTCGTDLKSYRYGHAKLPFGPFGHEGSGDIAKVGEGVAGFSVGQPVVWTPTAPCLQCGPCRRGYPNLCRHLMESVVLGTYADYVRINARVVAQHVLPKPENLPYIEAAFVEPLACVLHGWRLLEAKGNETVCILGTGSMGYLHLLEAKRRGCQVLMVGRRQERLTLANTLGADEGLLLHGRLDTETDLQSIARQVQAYLQDGADVVIEATGSRSGWEVAPLLAAPGGKVLLYSGLPRGTFVHLPAERLHYDELHLIGSFHYTTTDVHEAYQLLQEHALPVSALITAVQPLEHIREVFQDLDQGKGIKYAIIPTQRSQDAEH